MPLPTSPALRMRLLSTHAALPLRMSQHVQAKKRFLLGPGSGLADRRGQTGGPTSKFGLRWGGLGQPASMFMLQHCAARVRVLLTVRPAAQCNRCDYGLAAA